MDAEKPKQPTSELEQELSDAFGALDKSIQKLRIPVKHGHAIGQALGALANAVDKGLAEHGKEGREEAAKKYLESVKTEPAPAPLTPEQKAEAAEEYQRSLEAREGDVLTLKPAEVEKVAEDLEDVRAQEAEVDALAAS